MSEVQGNDSPSDDQWVHGLNLLKSGDYWEAHEAWEDVWRQLPDGSAAWFATKALIQLAAICYKPEQVVAGRDTAGMQRGMKRLIKTALSHLNESRTRTGPAPPWNRDSLGDCLRELEIILSDWQSGVSLTVVRRRVARVAGEFHLFS